MRWRMGRRSDNVEDQRGTAGGGFSRARFPGGGMRLPGGLGGLGRLGGRRGGIGGIGLVILLLIAVFGGGDFLSGLLGGGGGGLSVSPGGAPAPRSLPGGRPQDEGADFVSVVLADTEDTWNAVFAAEGQDYREPRLVLFSDQVQSACGIAGAAVGPFYCPADQKVYIDLAFFDELSRRFGAPGDFAQAYVIAHEVGHHIQNLLGISARVREEQMRLGGAEANALSVRLELQADCLAGVWAHRADRARNVLEAGDIEEALQAASAIGDDRLQRQARGRVVPDSFTHGTSEQRVRWFRRGLEAGDPAACDTFSAASL